MTNEEYKKLVKEKTPKEKKIKNIIISFIIGGIMGIIGQGITFFFYYYFGMMMSDAYMWTMVVLVVISSILTGFGFFDDIVSFAKCGLIVPSTGFAHAMTSSSMDARKEGFVKGIGAGIFKLVGSIILYALIAGFFVSLIKGVIL